MTNELNGKVAAITGAASGIGLECARAMLDAGATVVLIDRAGDKLTQLCAELGPTRDPAGDRPARRPASVAAMMPQILQKAGGLDIFHANAGAYVGGDVVDGDPDAWDRVLNLNINAAFRSVHAVLPHMVERRPATSSSPARSPGWSRWSGSRSTRRRNSPCRPSSTRPAAGRQTRHPRRRRCCPARWSPRCSTTGRRPRWRRRWPTAA